MANDNYGLTEAGFRLKRLRQILDEVQQNLSQVKDPDSGETLQVDFNEDDPFIQFINICCDQLSAIWEIMNAVADQFDPLKATGPMLSSLVQLNGIVRKNGTPSTVQIKFTGNPGVYIAIGTEVTDEDETWIWKTKTADSIGANGEVTIECASEENGAFVAEAGTINQLKTTIIGVQSVVNEAASTPGTPNENDINLRRRREKSTETPSRGLAESIYGSIMNLDGVEYCKVFTNRTLSTDANGIPAKSIAIVVQVDDKNDEDLKKEIANLIFVRSGLGEEYYGLQDIPGLPAYASQEVDYTDSLQQVTQIRFIYPVEIPIYVEVHVGDIEGTAMPNDYEARIKSNIVAFAKEGITALGVQIDNPDSFDTFGFPPSEDVAVSRLYPAILAVPGCKVNSLEIGTNSSSLSEDDIEILWYQVASFSASNITVIRDSE